MQGTSADSAAGEALFHHARELEATASVVSVDPPANDINGVRRALRELERQLGRGYSGIAQKSLELVGVPVRCPPHLAPAPAACLRAVMRAAPHWLTTV